MSIPQPHCDLRAPLQQLLSLEMVMVMHPSIYLLLVRRRLVTVSITHLLIYFGKLAEDVCMQPCRASEGAAKTFAGYR